VSAGRPGWEGGETRDARVGGGGGGEERDVPPAQLKRH